LLTPHRTRARTPPPHPLISGGRSSARPRGSTSSLPREPSPSPQQKEDAGFLLAESPSVPAHRNGGCDIGFPESGSAICWAPSPGYVQALATPGKLLRRVRSGLGGCFFKILPPALRACQRERRAVPGGNPAAPWGWGRLAVPQGTARARTASRTASRTPACRGFARGTGV